jgi:hypothetical protein
MGRYTVQPNCEGIDTADGTHYAADRTGHVTVHDPKHEAEIASSMTLGRGLMEREYLRIGNAMPGKHCEKCMFHAFAFSKTCPRCGTAFPELVPPDAAFPA